MELKGLRISKKLSTKTGCKNTATPAMTEVFGGHHSHTGEMQQTPRLTNTLLNGTNYPSWARSVYLFLHSKGKLSHITGKTEKAIEQTTNTEPETGKKTSTEQTDLEWQQNDTTVMT